MNNLESKEHEDASLNEKAMRWFYQKYHYVFAPVIKCVPITGDQGQPNKGVMLKYRRKDGNISYVVLSFHQEHNKFKSEVQTGYRFIMRMLGFNGTHLRFTSFVRDVDAYIDNRPTLHL